MQYEKYFPLFQMFSRYFPIFSYFGCIKDREIICNFFSIYLTSMYGDVRYVLSRYGD